MSAVSEVRFAVVREDPAVEIACVERYGLKNALVCASGGCTALALKHRFPELSVTAYDTNPAQLEHLARKVRAVENADLRALNVSAPSSQGLSQCGAFEKLFRTLRFAFCELVASPVELYAYFDPPCADPAAYTAKWFSSRYWPSLFAMVFCDAPLVAMFGPDAVQHAVPGSYPAYFQRAFERGLARADGPRNPFLQHVFLSHYRLGDAPPFVFANRTLDVTPHLGGLPDDLAPFDLVHLSNIFDWSSDALVTGWASKLNALRSGAVITLRQLNNDRPLRAFFERDFAFDEVLSGALLARDRSLFYNRIEVGVRR